ncbi:MAG: SoxR reducing system RseC family protein [Marinifilaceae bacterium]|jgi:sigma-E factor negative regulatory protein RseC|nr:SoxR reducing system RseC family protein [Marinifilaceae bacterium]
MNDTKTINHIGKIEHINDNTIVVKIQNQSACAGCHARGACSMADVKEKLIDIDRNPNDNYKIGEDVKIVCDQDLGFIAIFWAYVLPTILIFTSIILLLKLGYREGLAGLISLCILIPYYITLFLFRKKLKKRFTFRIEQIN